MIITHDTLLLVVGLVLSAVSASVGIAVSIWKLLEQRQPMTTQVINVEHAEVVQTTEQPVNGTTETVTETETVLVADDEHLVLTEETVSCPLPTETH